MPSPANSRRSAPRTAPKLYGCERPRLWTPPLRTLTRRTSDGYAVADFAQMTGEPLLPWERWTAIHGLELLPDGTYRFRTVLVLAARQNAKSHLKRTISLWKMYIGGAKRILGVAQDVALARDQWNLCQETIHDNPDLQAEWGRVRNVNGDEMFWAAGCRYAIKAFNRRAGRGGSNDEVNCDELREATDWKGWAAVSKTTMARPKGQIWALSNSGDDESICLNALQDAAHAGRDESLGIFEYSAPDGCELDDPAGIRQANPGLGHVVSMAAIRSALGTDPPNVYRAEILCQRVDVLESAVDTAAWHDCADVKGTMDGLRKQLTAVFDMSPDARHCTLSAAAKLSDGRVRTEIACAWDSTEQARAELPALRGKIRWRAFGWFPSGPAAAFAPLFRSWPEAEELTGGKASEACQGLADLVLARRIIHPAQPLLDTHISASRKLITGDGWRFTRRGGGHCDAAYATAGAVYLALTTPEPRRARIRVLVA
jgi:hypothetical protein